ncbi:MAG: hypothetical protein ACD_45C00484G0004 [uncultured bacterium]|nr:MAG: hypothetical protein ACD_45C00484G0004 [uncultured bacterium]
MDKPVLIIDMPELSDEAIVRIQEFLQDLMNSFESQNAIPIKRYYRKLYNDKEMAE